MRRLINCTPHAVAVENGGKRTEYPPSGNVVRVTMAEKPAGTICRITAITRQIVGVEGLPALRPGDVLIVSAMVLDHLPPNLAAVAPDTGTTAVRDEAGRLVAVTRFVVR